MIRNRTSISWNTQRISFFSHFRSSSDESKYFKRYLEIQCCCLYILQTFLLLDAITNKNMTPHLAPLIPLWPLLPHLQFPIILVTIPYLVHIPCIQPHRTELALIALWEWSAVML